MDDLLAFIISKYNYWVYIILMMIGLYAMIAKKNLVKKIIGMNILQTAIILFYVSIGAKRGATIPIILHGHGDAAGHAIKATDYMNPLPHVLMLTAIVVAVATLGVALTLAIKIYRKYGTLDEDDINAQLIGNGKRAP
jgi:multicomponent Na+:H+ antiporter subunit C